MNDAAKTKEQLLQELKGLRQRVTALEDSEAGYKKMEKIVRESEEQFRTMFENSHDLLTIADETGRTLWANLAWQTALGYTPDTQRNPIEHIHPDDRARVLEAWHAAECGEADFTNVEYRYQTARGSYVVLETTIRKAIAAGKPVLYVAAHDITEHKRAEEALRESEEKYRQLFMTVSDAIMIFDAQTRQFVDVNDATLRLYGYTREEFLQLTQTDITAESEESDLSIKQTLAGNLMRIPLRYYKKKDGTIFPVEISVGVFNWKEHKMVCGVVRDITKRKQAEERLKATLEAKATLLNEVHHRTRNNMQVLSGLLELHIHSLDNDLTRQFLMRLRERIDAMALIHRQLHREDLMTVDLQEYIEALAQMLLGHYPEHFGRVSFRFDIEAISMTIDPAVSFGLLLNEVVSNALKHAFPEGGTGEIQVSFHTVDEGQRELRVRDTGIGLPQDFDVNATASLGVRLITMLARDLQGAVEFQRKEQGTEVIVRFKELQYAKRV